MGLGEAVEQFTRKESLYSAQKDRPQCLRSLYFMDYPVPLRAQGRVRVGSGTGQE